MAETNNNSQQQTNNQQQNNTQQQTNTQQQNVPQIDVDSITAKITNSVLAGLSQQQNTVQQDNSTKLEKANGALTKAVKERDEEHAARIKAEAKLTALNLGVKPELLDDVVIIASSKVSKDKNIEAVISEMKKSNPIYFKEEENNQQQNSNKNITRPNTQQQQQNNNNNQQQQNQQQNNNGTFASRLYKSKNKQSSFFK